MYEFEHILPHFPVEYRRKICYSIICSFHTLQDGEYDEYAMDFVQISNLYLSIQHYEMQRLESAGLTNTRINPFDVCNLPPPLIGG